MLDPSDMISSASEKMLEHSGHFLRVKLIGEQRAMENAKLQELIASQAKENEKLQVEIKTLK
jgi:hypothetical protein